MLSTVIKAPESVLASKQPVLCKSLQAGPRIPAMQLHID